MADEKMVLLADSARALGFNGDFIATVLEKLGPSVLQLMVDAVRNGFSVELVVELLRKTGPTLLELIVALARELQGTEVGASLVAGELEVGERVELLDGALLKTLLEQFLPVIVEKYGSVLLKMLVDALLKAVSSTK